MTFRAVAALMACTVVTSATCAQQIGPVTLTYSAAQRLSTPNHPTFGEGTEAEMCIVANTNGRAVGVTKQVVPVPGTSSFLSVNRLAVFQPDSQGLFTRALDLSFGFSPNVPFYPEVTVTFGQPPNTVVLPEWSGLYSTDPAAAVDPATGDMWIAGLARQGINLLPSGLHVASILGSNPPALASIVPVSRNQDQLRFPCGIDQCFFYDDKEAIAFGKRTTPGSGRALYLASSRTRRSVEQGGQPIEYLLPVFRSLDRGATWAQIATPANAAPALPTATDPHNGPFSPIPLVMENGRLAIIHSERFRYTSAYSVVSDNADAPVADVSWGSTLTRFHHREDPIAQPEEVILGLTGGYPVFPAAALDPRIGYQSTNDVYVAYCDYVIPAGTSEKQMRVYVRRGSKQPGSSAPLTSSEPVVVPFGTAGAVTAFSDQFMPAITVDSLGGVHVAWIQADVTWDSFIPQWRVYHTRIADFPQTWRTFSTPTVLRTVTANPAFSTDEYLGLSASGQTVYCVFPNVDQSITAGDPTRAYITKIQVEVASIDP